MDKPKHTPGPWRVGMRPGRIVYGTKGEQVADLWADLLPREEIVANARLIAAAPEMLAALKACAEAIRHAEAERDPHNRLMPSPALQRAEEAIHKATGEE